MAFNPGVTFFISFHDLDPSKRDQCIYFTQKGKRCRWSCRETDNRKAIKLHQKINAISNEVVSLDLLREYVLHNCCREGRAQHQDRIEDVGLLMPLAQRWQDEIQRLADSRIPVTPPRQSIFMQHAYTTPATPNSSGAATVYIPSARPSSYQPISPESIRTSTTSCTPVAISSHDQLGSRTPSNTPEPTSPPSRSQPRYNLRPREADTSTGSTSTPPASTPEPVLSEFRPHIRDPLPSDSVSQKILDPLLDRDFETGSLYIFHRVSSLGHVKIGWTAKSISGRLNSWSMCGYTPILLFSVTRVPHAQRVETLTHYELIKEWRRERMCKASWCRKSHQEWFEVSNERAERVLNDWALFMTRAEPYDSKGRLKGHWREFIEMMDGKGEVVTAKILLKHYDELVEEATFAKTLLDSGHAPKVEEKADFEYEKNLSGQEVREEVPVCVGLVVKAEPASPKKTLLLKIQEVSEPIQLAEIAPPKLGTQSKSAMVHGRLSASQTTPIKKELSPERIPLPPSTTLQPAVFRQHTTCGRERKSSSSTDTKGTSATDLLVKSPTNTVAEPLSHSKTSSSVSPCTVVLHSTMPTTEAPKILLSTSTNKQVDVVEAPIPKTKCEQNAAEAREKEHVESHDEDKFRTTETEPWTGADEWDAEITLVGDQISRSLEKAPLEIVSELPIDDDDDGDDGDEVSMAAFLRKADLVLKEMEERVYSIHL